MKLIAAILLISFASCATLNPEYAEQAVLDCYIMQSRYHVIIKLKTVRGKEIVYRAGGTGIGLPHYQTGDKYTVHFKGNKVVRITKNQ